MEHPYLKHLRPPWAGASRKLHATTFSAAGEGLHSEKSIGVGDVPVYVDADAPTTVPNVKAPAVAALPDAHRNGVAEAVLKINGNRFNMQPTH